MAEVRPYDIASLCFDARGQKFMVIVGSQISKLATGRKAASFFELLELGVKRAVDLKFKANANPEERRKYREGLVALIPTNPLHVADEIHSQLREVCFYQWLRQEFRQFKIRNQQPTSVLKCLQKVGGHLLTTNYDLILEKSKLPPNCKFGGEVPESDRPLNILVEGDYEDIAEVIAGPKQAIVHLFGTYESDIVFTTSDHKSYTSNADAMAHLQSIFYHSHVLFVGFEKDDPFLNTLYKVMIDELRMGKRLGSTRNRHYILVPNSELRTFGNHFKGVLPVPYGSSLDELVNFLKMTLEAIYSHQRGQKRRKDDDEENGDLPAGIKRAHLISEDHSAIRQTASVVPEYFNIPKDRIHFGADTGPFASIHFSIDMPEEYIPTIWDEAVRSNNVFVKCGCMAIQIGTGPMLWMREHHGPEHPLPGQQLDGIANQGDGQGVWTKIKPRRRAWHYLPDLKPFEIRQQVKISAHDQGDQAKTLFGDLKRHLKERFGCSSVYRWSKNFVTFVCQGSEQSVKIAVKFLQRQSQEHFSKQYSKVKSDRQFACEDCDVVWWAYVPKGYPVTLCPKCHTCYKALNRWDQYGYADFECSCGLKFEGSDRFYKWSSIECPRCSKLVRPYRIRRPHQKPLTVKRPSALTLSPFTAKGAVQKNVPPRQIPDKHSGNEPVGGTRNPQEQKQITQSLTKDAQEILTRWPKSSRSAKVEDTAKIDDTSEASSVHPKPLHHPFILKHAGKPIASLFQDQVSDLKPELLRSQEEKSKPTQRNHPPISRSKYQMKKERELQRKSVSRRRKFSARMNSTSNFAKKNSGTQPVVSEVGEQDKRYAPKIAKGEQLSEPSNQQLPTEQSKRFTAMQGGELPEVVQKLFQTLGEIPASSSISGPSDIAATVNSEEFPRESSHIAGSSASGFSPNVLKKLKLLEEPPEAGNVVPDAAFNDRKGSMEASLTSRPLLRALISSSSMTPETTVTKHSTADIRFMPTALSETHNFLTASETGTKVVFTSAAMRETGSKSTSQNSFQETVLEVDTQGGSSCTTPSVHTHTAQHSRESNVKGEWTDIECLPSESCAESKTSDVKFVPISKAQMVCSGIPSNSQNSSAEVTHRVEANRIVQMAINNALERVGDGQICISRTQDFKSDAGISPEGLSDDDMRGASHKFIQQATCTYSGSNLEVANTNASPESDLRVPLPSSGRQDTKESFLPGGETERPVVFHLPDQTDINQQNIHSEKQPGEETVQTEFMHEKLQSTVQSFSSEQLKERSEFRTDSSQEVHSGAVSLDVRNFNTRATAVEGGPENEKLDTEVSGEITIEEQAVELVPEIKHSSENKAAEECKLPVHKITMASAHGVDTNSVYSEQLEVKVEGLQKGEGSVMSGAHGTLLLKLDEEKESSTPGNESNKNSRIHSDDLLGEEPLASPLMVEAVENSDQSMLPNVLNSSSYDAHVSSEKLKCKSKVVFADSSDLVGKKEMPVEPYPHMVESINPVAVMNPGETSVEEMLQPFSEVDDIGSQSSPIVHNMNVERDAELCKVHVPEISVACSNPIEDGGHSLGDSSSEDNQALNDTLTTATTGLSASTATTAGFEIGIPSDDNACSVQISLEQQSQISKLHTSSQPDSTIDTDTGPHPSYPGSSNTRTGKVAHDENAEVVINGLEDATDTSTPVERTTDGTMTQPPYCNADVASPEMRTKPSGEDDSDSEESHLQTCEEQLGHCLIVSETSTVIQTLVGPRTSKPEEIIWNGTVNPQEEGMPCIDNGQEPLTTFRRSQVTESIICKTELVLEILDDILEAAVQEGDHGSVPHSICNPKEQEPLDELPEFSSFSLMSQQEEISANLKEETKVKANPSGTSHTGKVVYAEQEQLVIDRLKDSTDTSELVQETPDSSMAQPHSRADIASPHMRPETSETGTKNVSDSEESHLQARKEQVDPLEVCLIAREETTLKQTLVRPSTSNSKGITLNGKVDSQEEDVPCISNGLEPHCSLNSDQGRSQVITYEVCETEMVVDILDDIFEAAVQEGDCACAPHSICNPKEREPLDELPEFGSLSSVSQQGANVEEKSKVKASPSGSPHTCKVAHAEQAEVVINRLEDSTDTSELVQGTRDSSMAQPHSRADIASPHLKLETSETGTENVSDTEESQLQARKEQVDPLEICLIAREETTLKQTLVRPSTSNPEGITLNGEVDPQEEDVPCINNGLEPHSSLKSDQGRSQVITYEVCETEMVVDILDDIVEAAVQEGDRACAPHSICNPKEREPLDELPEFGSFSSVSQQGTNIEEKSKVKASPSGSHHTCKVAHAEQAEVVIDRLEDSTDTSELVQGTPDSSMAQPQSNADIASLESRLETSEHDREDTNVSKRSHLQSSKEQLDAVHLEMVTCTIKETPEEPRATKCEEIPPNVKANSQEESVPCNNDILDSSKLSSDQGRLQVTECKTVLDIVEASVQEGDHACVPSSDWNQREQEHLEKSSSFSPAPQQDEKELNINLSSSPHTDKVTCVELTEAEIGRSEDSTNGSPICRSPDSPTVQLPTGSTNNTTPEMRHTPASESDRVDSEDPEEYHPQSSKDDDPSKCVVHHLHESVVQEGDCACTQPDTCHPAEQERLPDVGSYSPVTQQNQIRAGLERESKINPSSSLCTGEVAHAEKTEIVIPNDTLELVQEVPDSTMSQPLHSSTYTEHLKLLSAETGLEVIKEPEELHVQGSKEQIDPLEVCFVAKEALNTTSEEPKVPRSEDLSLNDDTDSKKNVSGSYVNNGSGFLPTQTIDQSTTGTTEYGTVHVIALDILNDIIYAVIQKCHEHIPLDDHEPELPLPGSDNLTPCISTPEPDDFNRPDHRVSEKAVTNGSCPTLDLVAAANSSVLVVASAAGTPDEHTVHKAVAGSPLTPISGTDFGHRESSPLASEEDKGVVETKGIEFTVGNGGEASTASARESKSSIMDMSPPYSETDSESESSGSDGYEQDASETESEETISQTPQDVATIEVGYVLEESAPDPRLSEPDVCKQDTLRPAKVKDTVHAHHRTTPSVFTEQELSHPNPPQVQTRTKKRPRYLSKFKDKDQKIRRNVYIPSECHNCTGDTDDETRSAGLQARPVVFEFKQEIFHRL